MGSCPSGTETRRFAETLDRLKLSESMRCSPIREPLQPKSVTRLLKTRARHDPTRPNRRQNRTLDSARARRSFGNLLK